MTTPITKNTPLNITIGVLILIVGFVWVVAAYAASVDSKIESNSTSIKLIEQQMDNDSDRLERIEIKLDKVLGI